MQTCMYVKHRDEFVQCLTKYGTHMVKTYGGASDAEAAAIVTTVVVNSHTAEKVKEMMDERCHAVASLVGLYKKRRCKSQKGGGAELNSSVIEGYAAGMYYACQGGGNGDAE